MNEGLGSLLNNAGCDMSKEAICRDLSIMDSLVKRRDRMSKQLNELNIAIDALKNTETLKTLELLMRVRNY